MPANGQAAAAAQINTTGNVIAAGVRTATSAVSGAVTTAINYLNGAPAKASAAPGGNNQYTFLGLCDAMNSYEQELVSKGSAQIANIYEIQFNPPSLAQSKITLPGPTDYSKTAVQQNRTAAAVVNPATNSVNMNTKNIAVTAGQQIAQVIEFTLRNSSYITDQLNAIGNQLDSSADSTPSTSSSNNNTTSWFKIIVNAVPIGNKIDTIRNDYAYHITYIITTYAINEMRSQYFPEAQFRGVHKSYDYWFTGKNTQVLNFEQAYNNQYFQVLSSKDPAKTMIRGNESSPLYNTVGYGLGTPRKVVSPPSQSNQQAQNDANNPQASGADFLYSFFDQDQINLSIVGDPAWLFQGEQVGILANNLVFTGFYPDGTICTETQQPVFAINWNAPADYDNGTSGPYSGTGLMNVNASSTQGNNNNLATSPSQVSGAYVAMTVKNVFSKGKFTQDITGVALKNLNQNQINQAQGRSTNTTNTNTLASNQAQSGTRTSLLQQVENAVGSAVGTVSSLVKSATPTWATNIINGFNNPVQTPNSATPAVGAPTQPATPATDPISSGVTVGAASSSSSPPNAATVSVFGPTSIPVTTAVTPSASTLALQSGQTVVFGNTQTQVSTQTQIMVAKDA